MSSLYSPKALIHSINSAVTSELSNHPPHLISPTPGLLPPSAFIPFCSLGGDMTQSGQYIQGLSLPVCTAFLPVLHRGQLCFRVSQSSLDLLSNHGGAGVKNSLKFLLDTNAERSSAILNKSNDNSTMDLDPEDFPEDDHARIHIQTLSPFTGHGPGHFQMIVLKQTTGSEEFLSLPDHKKKCQEELREECEVRVWEEAVLARCHCSPFSVARMTGKVSYNS